jgi:two-component system response regulator ChvI
VKKKVPHIDQKRLAKLLVVDDEAEITHILKRGLENNRFVVDSFTDPIEALTYYSEHSKEYCLIISDVRMPSISGFEFVRRAKQMNPDIKTILLTAFEINKTEVAKVLPSLDVDDFVKKPIRVDALAVLVMKHISKNKRLLNT